MVTDKKGSKGKRQNKQKPIPIACPNIDSATLEGLIDLLIIKGVLTEDELTGAADLYGSYINALLDILNVKGIVKEWELDLARVEYHHFVQAMGQSPNIPPVVLFERRRNVIRDRLELEKTSRPEETA
jgi:hypothetical protein